MLWLKAMWHAVITDWSFVTSIGTMYGAVLLICNCWQLSATFSKNSPILLFKLSSNLNSLLFSSYYGGSSRDACYSVKVDNAQNVLFAGGTQSNNLPGISGTWQTLFGGGTADGFVVKLPSAGNTITAASYVGKGGYDQVFFVEYDRDNNIFVLVVSTIT